MARIYTEGFENGSIANDRGVVGPVAVTNDGRRGAYSLISSTYPFNSPAYRTPLLTALSALETGLDEIWVRTAIRQPNPHNVVFSVAGPGGHEVKVIAGENGTVAEVRVNDVTVITGTLPMYVNTWYLIELHYKLSATDGVVELRVQGQDQGEPYTGNTAPLGSEYITHVYWWGNQYGLQWTAYDDLAINDNDDTDGAIVGWCHDGYVIGLRPNEAGDSSDWQRNVTPATANYLMVQDYAPDFGSTYVYSQTVDDTDFYNVEPLSGLKPDDIISRVWVSAYANESAADGNTFKLGLKTNDEEKWPDDPLTLTTNWEPHRGPTYDSNPITHDAWTQEEINDLQVGIKVV